METYPLKSMSLEEAKELQFHVVNCMMQEFDGREALSRGDLGVVAGLNKPAQTVSECRIHSADESSGAGL